MANAQFIPSLESVRGLAALSVCLFHAAEVRFQDGVVVAKHTIPGIFLNGYGAVILFFVLSGYVLRSSLEKKAQSGTVALTAEFLIARLFRLFPVIVASVAVFVIVMWIVYRQEPQFAVAVRNALLLEASINGAFWTLQVEVFGSVLVLVAFLLERRLGTWAVWALLIVLLPVSFTGGSSMIGPVSPTFFYTFLLGYLIAVRPPLPPGRPQLAAALLVIAMAAFYGANSYGYVYKQWLLLVTALAASMIVLVMSSEGWRDRLQWPPVRWLGAVSYSFYALHPLGLKVEGHLLAPVGGSGWPSWLIVAILLTAPVAVTAIITVPMYCLIERPGVALGRWMLSRRRTVSAATVKPS